MAKKPYPVVALVTMAEGAGAIEELRFALRDHFDVREESELYPVDDGDPIPGDPLSRHWPFPVINIYRKGETVPVFSFWNGLPLGGSPKPSPKRRRKNRQLPSSEAAQ